MVVAQASAQSQSWFLGAPTTRLMTYFTIMCYLIIEAQNAHDALRPGEFACLYVLLALLCFLLLSSDCRVHGKSMISYLSHFLTGLFFLVQQISIWQSFGNHGNTCNPTQHN